MKIQTQYLTTNNSYDVNEPCAIVVHNTDNFDRTATAKAHAEGLKNGYMSGMSWHVAVDDKEAYQCLPYNRGAWHVGVNYGNQKLFGKINNRNSICVEMCVNAGYDYEKAFQNTVDVVRQLMKELNIPAERVYQHYDICNKDCPSQIRKKGDWNRFKKLIGAAGTNYDVQKEIQVDQYYRVRTSWDNATSQLGAYSILQNAVNNCPYGYHVFDWNGKIVYSPQKPAGTQSAEFNGLTEPQAAAKILEMARDEGKRAHILPSLIAAQAILESGYCRATDLVKKSNNCFGMKCTLSGNTWNSVWDGVSKVQVKTQEQDPNGNAYYINADFRAYPCIEKSFEDHSCYILGAMNGNKKRYAGLTECKTYREAITLVKNGGYATDVNYISKLCNIVERFGLDKYDNEVTPTPAPAPQVIDRYKVSHSLDDDAHRLGLFHELMNAEQLADLNWGYYVFDIVTGQKVYDPGWSTMQKFVAEMVYMDLLVRDDIKAKKAWKYKNKNTSSFSKTFDEARANNNRYTNCVSGVQWALLRAGLPRKAIQWYGNKGIVWVGTDAEKNARKYFDIITVNKTVKTALKENIIQPGDILTYSTIGHTNAYIANGVWFDSGHAYCNGSGEGAKYISWTGATKYNAYKVAKILRLKQ